MLNKDEKGGLTAAEWSHLSVLCINLGDVRHAPTQHVRRDLIAKLVLPLTGLNASPMHLRTAVRYKHKCVWVRVFMCERKRITKIERERERDAKRMVYYVWQSCVHCGAQRFVCVLGWQWF